MRFILCTVLCAMVVAIIPMHVQAPSQRMQDRATFTPANTSIPDLSAAPPTPTGYRPHHARPTATPDMAYPPPDDAYPPPRIRIVRTPTPDAVIR